MPPAERPVIGCWRSGGTWPNTCVVNHGRESHVTTQLDFHGHGIGTMLLPVVAWRGPQGRPEGSV